MGRWVILDATYAVEKVQAAMLYPDLSPYSRPCHCVLELVSVDHLALTCQDTLLLLGVHPTLGLYPHPFDIVSI